MTFKRKWIKTHLSVAFLCSLRQFSLRLAYLVFCVKSDTKIIVTDAIRRSGWCHNIHAASQSSASRPEHQYTHMNLSPDKITAYAVGSGVGQINEVTLRRARLVLGWVTVSGFPTPGAVNLSQSNQPSRSTQPGLPSVGRCNEYLPKGGNALRLRVKAYMVLFAGNTVWSISERVIGVCVDALYKSEYTLLLYSYESTWPNFTRGPNPTPSIL